MENEVVTILLNIQADVAATKEAVQALAGPQGRVTVLEESQYRQWWFSVAIAPILALLHAFARKFGVNV